MKCPTCGCEVRRPDPREIIATLGLSNLERRLADCLLNKFGEFVPNRAITDYVYKDHPDGGPLSADNAVSVRVILLKRRLVKTPLTVEFRFGGAGPGAGRRLTWRLEQGDAHGKTGTPEKV